MHTKWYCLCKAYLLKYVAKTKLRLTWLADECYMYMVLKQNDEFHIKTKTKNKKKKRRNEIKHDLFTMLSTFINVLIIFIINFTLSLTSLWRMQPKTENNKSNIKSFFFLRFCAFSIKKNIFFFLILLWIF